MSLKLKIGTFLLSFALGIGGVAAISYAAGINYGGPAIQQESDGSGLDTEVEHAEGMKLKLLSTETRANGDTVQTFSYTITPANATNQNINVAVNYATGGAATEVTASVNTGAKTITITCKQAFDKVINVVLTAADGGGATATIKCDYQKKITNFELTGDSIFESSKTNSGQVNLNTFIFGNENSNNWVTYSKYTQDFDYLNDAVLSGFNEAFSIEYLGDLDDSEEAYAAFESFFKGEANLPSAQQIWGWAGDISLSQQSSLKTKGYLQVGIVDFDFTASNGNTTYSYKGPDGYSIKIIYDFSTFDLNISSINPGQSSVLF